MYYIWDKLVGFYRRKRNLLLVGNSLQEVLDYYKFRYQELAPEPMKFKKILMRCGLPIHGNPYPEGSIEHFNYPQEKMLFSDLEYPLAYIKSTINMDRLFDDNEIDWIEKSSVCWAMALQYGNKSDFEALYKDVHIDNLTLLTIFVLQHDFYSHWRLSREKVAKNAEYFSLINESVKSSILSEPLKILKEDVQEKNLFHDFNKISFVAMNKQKEIKDE